MSTEREKGVRRRRILKTALASVGAGAAALTSVGTSPEPPTSTSTADRTPERSAPNARLPPVAEEYETAINVLDAEVDPDGSTPILQQLSNEIDGDTLLFFPEGRYWMDGHWDLSDVERLAFVGPNAEIVPTDGYKGTLFYAGENSDLRSFRVEGLTFDFSTPGTGARPLNVMVRDELHVKNVTVRGTARAMGFNVTSPDGRGHIQRLRLPDGGLQGAHEVGCLVGPANQGALVFSDCTIAGFPNNGLYASPSKGPVNVLGGTYANNGIANVRVSGPSTVRGVTVECNRAPDDFQNMRGIWIRGGECTIEDCQLSLEQLTYSDGGIVGSWRGGIQNTRIRIDADGVPAISIKPLGDGSGQGIEPSLDCSGVDIRGSAANEAAVQVTDYDSCRFEDVSIRQTGENRDGFYLIRSDDTVIRDSTIDVTGEPLRLENSTIETDGVETSEYDPELPGTIV